VKRLVRDTCFGLRTLGAKRVVFATFHGEPLHNLAIDDGVKLLRSWNVAAMATMNLVLNESVEMNLDDYAEVFATIPDETERMRCRDGFPADFHAGFFETSLMLHWRPECVGKNWRDLPPCPPLGSSPAILAIARFFKNRGNGKLAREIEFAHFGLQWAKLRPVGGYTGRPAPSNPDAGRIFATRIAAIVARSMREYFFDGKLPPEPIHRWVRTLSLDGRIG
jgi:creatinine amidohydrolase